jgi:hypothetical protein
MGYSRDVMNPEVRVEQEKMQRGDKPDRWRIAWLIENLGDAPLKILAARAPHGKFRCDEKEFTPPVDLAANQRGRIELEVRCCEAEGAEVENAFLILRVLYAGGRWLILVRLRVYVAEEGKPVTTSELITAQPVGFSSKL